MNISVDLKDSLATSFGDIIEEFSAFCTTNLKRKVDRFDDKYFLVEVDVQGDTLLICDLVVNTPGEDAGLDSRVVQTICRIGKKARMFVIREDVRPCQSHFWEDNGFVALDDIGTFILEEQLASYSGQYPPVFSHVITRRAE